ncbi:MAG: IPT/TIG domain-containing protein [Patescibacteria group bacterium]|nr:IPT/TIG domain-containing protein [Patescibacteria group bacterium]
MPKLPNWKTPPIIFILFLVVTIPVTVLLVQQSTQIGTQATTTPTSLTLSTIGSSFIVNDPVEVQVYLDTKGLDIDAVDMILNYDASKLEAIGVNPMNLFGKYCGTTCSANLNPISVSGNNGKIILSGLAWSEVNEAPSAPYNGVGEFARIIFNAKEATTSTTVSFDFTSGSTTDSNVVQHLTAEDTLGTANPINITVNSPLLIRTLSSSSGEVGTTVTIGGSGFGSSAGKVFFSSNVEAPIRTWIDTQITTTVPTGASTGPITIQTAGNQNITSSFIFTVTQATLPPTITSLDPLHGLPLTSVVINGSNFGANGSVTFNGVQATEILGWTTSVVTVRVPENATSGPVIVSVNAVGSNNDKIFTVDAYSPSIATINPASATNSASVQITIIGNHFNNPSVKLTKANTPEIAGSIVSSNISQIVANFDITNKSTGTWILTVTNSDNLAASTAFEVTTLTSTVINFTVKFQAAYPLSNAKAASDKEITLILRKVSGTIKTDILNTKVTTVAEKNNGIFTNGFKGTVSVEGLQPTTGSDYYELHIKGSKHLAKNFSLIGFNLNQTNNYDFTGQELPTADIGSLGEGAPDNKISLADYGILLNDYYSQNLRSDLNYDGKVSLYDYGYLLNNYVSNIRTGDP